VIFKKKKNENRREGRPEYKKQQSYHYSAKRSSTDRLYGRQEHLEENENPAGSFTKRNLSLLPSFLSIVLIIAGSFYLLHLSPSVSLETEGSSGFVGDRAAVQSKAEDLMKASLLNRTKLSFNEEELEEALYNEFPEFSSIKVKTLFFRQKPVVAIKFAQPTMLLTNGSNNYIISEEGVVLADITKTKPDIDTSKLLLVQDQTGVDIELGKVALTSEQVDYILEITFQTSKKNLKIESLILVPGGGELHARYGGLKYYVKYNLYEDARKSSGTFLAAKANLEKKGVTPSEYIDVRIPERAYIK